MPTNTSALTSQGLIRVLDDATLVALVTALTGGSVPEYVIRDQAKRSRRDFHPRGMAPVSALAA